MSKFLDNPKIKKANYHTRQIRDLTNLLLLYLKRDDIEYSNEFTEFALSEVVAEQIALIKDGISTLRISSDEHEESLLKMEIPVTIIGETKIAINKEFAKRNSIGDKRPCSKCNEAHH
ncbi:MAG: hypothetical protein IPJ75_11620 [Ignavibacteriales bacterium]|nr:hypothetical protein [Ignavibacteriales bacterium]